ncbi:hypothetical protein ACWKWU_10025 [Chitinophaga lutea]
MKTLQPGRYCLPAFVAGIFCLIAACTSEQAPAPGPSVDCATTNITSTRVFTLVQQNCSSRGCHPGGSSPNGSDFSTLAKLKSYITANGDMWRLRVTGPQADMPQSQNYPELPRTVRDSIACWVQKGMPD